MTTREQIVALQDALRMLAQTRTEKVREHEAAIRSENRLFDSAAVKLHRQIRRLEATLPAPPPPPRPVSNGAVNLAGLTADEQDHYRQLQRGKKT